MCGRIKEACRVLLKILSGCCKHNTQAVVLLSDNQHAPKLYIEAIYISIAITEFYQTLKVIMDNDVCMDGVCMYVHTYVQVYVCMYICIYNRTSIIQTPNKSMCHLNVNGVQISEFVRISELSDKIHYLAS